MSYPKSIHIERVRELAARGLSAREIGETIGLSRQSASRIGRTYGIPIRHEQKRRPAPRSHAPKKPIPLRRMIQRMAEITDAKRRYWLQQEERSA